MPCQLSQKDADEDGRGNATWAKFEAKRSRLKIRVEQSGLPG